MQAPKSLRRPQNWTDFETLCKKLWGEIWNCPEIQKNGRSGQSQHGVDVYGIPQGENAYYGIQCKGKDEYTNKQFSIAEIDSELEKAKGFEPALKKLYFATTAVKDSVIETYIRKKNLEHMNQGLFQIYLFSWEDIVDLIDENRETHDWYLNSNNFKRHQEVSVTFHTGKHEIMLKPIFLRDKTVYTKSPKLEAVHRKMEDMLGLKNFLGSSSYQLIRSVQRLNTRRTNFSYVPFSLVLTNIGTEALENFKVDFKIEDEIQDLSSSNTEDRAAVVMGIIPYTNTFLDKGERKINLRSKKTILVGDDTVNSDYVYIKPLPEATEIKVSWKMISKHFKANGELLIKLEPEIKRNYREVNVDDEAEERTEWGDFQDYFEDASIDS